MKKLAIIGASYLQNPLILKAKEMGLETHVLLGQQEILGRRRLIIFIRSVLWRRKKF